MKSVRANDAAARFDPRSVCWALTLNKSFRARVNTHIWASMNIVCLEIIIGDYSLAG